MNSFLTCDIKYQCLLFLYDRDGCFFLFCILLEKNIVCFYTYIHTHTYQRKRD